MSLLKCPECGGSVSSEANACPHCGYPIKKENKPQEVREKRKNIVVPPVKEGFPYDAPYLKGYKERGLTEKLIITLVFLVSYGILIPVLVCISLNIALLIAIIFWLLFITIFWIDYIITIKNYCRMVEGQTAVLYKGFTSLRLMIDGKEVDVKHGYMVSAYLYGKLKGGHTLKVRVNDFKGITFFIDE